MEIIAAFGPLQGFTFQNFLGRLPTLKQINWNLQWKSSGRDYSLNCAVLQLPAWFPFRLGAPFEITFCGKSLVHITTNAFYPIVQLYSKTWYISFLSSCSWPYCCLLSRDLGSLKGRIRTSWNSENKSWEIHSRDVYREWNGSSISSNHKLQLTSFIQWDE